MLRNGLALVLGLALGMAVNMALITLNTSVLFPLPPGWSMENPEQMNAYVASLPAAAFIVVLAAHLGQAFVGAWVAARIAEAPMLLAMVIGALSLVGGILSAVSIDGPAWLMIEMPLYLVVAWFGGRLAMGQRSRRGAAR